MRLFRFSHLHLSYFFDWGKTNIIVLLWLGLFSQCTAQVSLNHLDNHSQFEELCGPPLTDKYSELKAVKVVYDIKTKTIHYLDNKKFKLHHEFCSRLVGYEINIEQFNALNYSDDPNRKYLLANINYIKSLDKYALELSPVDLMTDDQLQILYKTVSKSTFIGSDLVLYLNSQRLNTRKIDLAKLFPIILPAEIYKTLKYQPISKNNTYGILRFVKDIKKEKEPFRKTDILVLKKTPLVLPQVAGIIVSEFQTPLSHLTILGQNRKIPICAQKGAYKDSLLMAFSGIKIRFEVKADSFLMEEVTSIENNETTYRPPINLRASLIVDSLVGVNHLSKRSRKFVGNKAAYFGMLHKLSKKYDFKTPEGAFAIPFYFYNQHIQSSDAARLISQLEQIDESDSIKVALKNIRKIIKATTLDATLLSDVENRILKNGAYTRMRFRSSTNAEDAVGFSGAGLYKSKTGILYSKEKPIDKAIKKVWASLWSYQAYMERVYFNMNQKNLYMGVLVHRSFPTETVNGVAITKNLYRPENFGFVVNAQLGNESVVQPSEGVISDQFICYPSIVNVGLYDNKSVIDIITTSSLSDGKLIMTDDEITSLANQLERIKRYYSTRSLLRNSYIDFGLDIEFKLDGPDRQLYIKQVRIYND